MNEPNMCPRCNQQVTRDRITWHIRKHRDPLVRDWCPVYKMTLDEARSWVDRERARLEALR